MNYRHAFHAGNFADVVKHVLLGLLIERLEAKPTAFRVIDTHAGTGLTDLAGGAAGRTGEWRDGVGRVFGRTLDPAAEVLLAPWRAALAAANPDGGLRSYPGSPAIVRHLLRRQDRLTAVELHPEDRASLAERFVGDRQVRVIDLDGWLALPAFVPPKERRGLVLVDPPYEERDEFTRLAAGLVAAHRRWPTGIYAAWYPVKDTAAVFAFREGLRRSGLPKLLDTVLTVERPDGVRFVGSGLVVVNPPWGFAAEAAIVLAALQPLLMRGPGGGAAVSVLTGEDGAPAAASPSEGPRRHPDPPLDPLPTLAHRPGIRRRR